MDEGKAALYAAIIGFAAAIIGAAVGGWASWRAARHQVIGGAENEHRHWVRQERRAAYGHLIRGAHTLDESIDGVDRAAEEADRSEDNDDHFVQAVRTMANHFQALCTACDEIYIFGSRPLAESAVDLRQAYGTLVQATLKAGKLGLDSEELAQAQEDSRAARDIRSDTFGDFLSACHYELVGKKADPTR
ncbi:hypothetical protein [Streptomyces tubercidicus]|uniref:hypothetical protein n=1 Tax=Streptomyces tubercidicus TaxID=47759 RepID=UPI0036A76D13